MKPLTKDKDKAPSSNMCPVTGLPMLRRSRWTDVDFGGDYKATVSVVGSQILLSQPSGYATRLDIEKAFQLGCEVSTETIASRPYVCIEDCSQLKGATIGARICHINNMSKGGSPDPLGLIYCGLSPMLKMGIKLGKRLNTVRSHVHIVDDYSEAVTLALRMLSKEKSGPEAPDALKGLSDGKGDVSSHIVTNPEWQLNLDGFSLRYEVIDGKILHSVCAGYMEERHVEAVSELREKIRKATIPTGGFDYIVVNVSDVRGGSRRARRLYVNSLKQCYGFHPFRMYIFYGVDRFMRAAANLARPFMPFRIQIANDLNSALRLINEDEGKTLAPPPPWTATDANGKPSTGDHIEQHVDDLLHVLGSIDWETDGLDDSPQADPSHPFRPVFDAIALVKGELDDLFQERKRAEEALRKSEERYRILIEESPSAVAMIAKDGHYRYINPKFAEMLGYTMEDISTGREWFNRAFPDPEYRNEVVSTWISDLKESKIGEVRPRRFVVTCKDGSKKHIHFRPVTLATGDQFVIYEDVSERKEMEKALQRARDHLEIRVAERTAELIQTNEQLQRQIEERRHAEEALRESIERFKETADLLPTMICEMDADMRVTYVNNLGFKALGYSQADVDAGVHIMDVIHPDHRGKAAKRIERLMGGERLEATEYRLLSKDGSEVLALFNSSPIHKDGQFVGIRTSVTDVTELRRLQRQLQQAQKMEAIGTLAGGIAHDFNNLLMGIQGRVSLMFMDIDSDHHHFVHVSGIENAVRKGADLTKQLLGFARGGKYEVRPTDLNDLIEKSSEMLGRAKKEIKIHRKYQEDVWTVEVDRGQIEQVLVNLHVNAWQAMPGGGDLYLATKNVRLGRKFTQAFDVAPGHYVNISATDTGVGMDKTTRQRVFEPFFTTKEMGGGTGLGLASAYGIIKNHGGIIDVYSEPGQGATFNIYLPASEKEIEKDAEPLVDVLEGTETVLLVDDEDMIIEVGREMLTALGYKVIAASSGRRALELYEEKKGEIDMVVLDLVMPDMGGAEVYERLKEISPKVKVLLSSGYSMDDRAQDILKRGCNGFIQKPFNMNELSVKLRQIL
ncbi:MAG: PAS domain S-box protein [Thermodesulfobacteriota bacterium]|nr:PAS domain S-box protein [Thermodesulfobacteriota bacterium]